MGTSPGCRQALSASPSWALGGCGGVRRTRAPLLPPGSLAVLEGPWRPQRDIIRTNSARARDGVGRKQHSQAQLRPPPPNLPRIRGPPTAIGPLPIPLVHSSWRGRGGCFIYMADPSETFQGSPWENVQYPVAGPEALPAVAPADVSLSRLTLPELQPPGSPSQGSGHAHPPSTSQLACNLSPLSPFPLN